MSDLYKHTRTKIQDALGNGWDEEAWRPGEEWLDEACRCIKNYREMCKRLNEHTKKEKEREAS